MGHDYDLFVEFELPVIVNVEVIRLVNCLVPVSDCPESQVGLSEIYFVLYYF